MTDPESTLRKTLSKIRAQVMDSVPPTQWAFTRVVLDDYEALLLPLVAQATAWQPDEVLLKARKLLEALEEPCEPDDKTGDHLWRNCRRCMAIRRFDFDPDESRILVRRILDALPSPPQERAR